MRLNVCSVVALALATLFSFATPAAQPRQQPRMNVIPVVGHWTDAQDGGVPIVIADARQWDPASQVNLAAVAKRLFSAPHAAFAAHSSPGTAFPLAVALDPTDFTAGTLRVQFKLMAGESDKTAGLAFGLDSAANYLFVRYNTKDGNLAVWEFVDGQRKALAHGETHAQLPLDAWHTLEVTVSGRRVSGIVRAAGSAKAVVTVEHVVERPVAGRVGFWTKRDSVSAFKELQVSRR